jgi:hypothetical protein
MSPELTDVRREGLHARHLRSGLTTSSVKRLENDPSEVQPTVIQTSVTDIVVLRSNDIARSIRRVINHEYGVSPERLLERTLEVPHRHQGIAGERGHIERLGIVPVNSVTCSHQAGEVGAIHRGNPWPEQAALKCRAGATAGTRSSGTCPSPRPSRPCGPAPPRPRRPRPAASRWRRCRGAPCWRSPRQQRRRRCRS